MTLTGATAENALRAEVCHGTLTLREAQSIIATDWFRYYQGEGAQVKPRVGIILAVCLVLLGVGLAAAQPFRIAFRRDPDEPTSIVLRGEVFNDDGRDLVDVWVTAEAMSAGDHVVSRGIAFVTSFLRGRGSTPFTVKLPRMEEPHSFRLSVSSFRYASGTQSP